MTVLPTVAAEEGTYVISLTFKDEDGTALTPTTLTWTLTDEDGTVVNSRSGVAASVAATINIVLSGDDLALSDAKKRRRCVSVSGTYTSTYGAALPLKDEIWFTIRDLLKVT